ncbi:MAG: GntR family transcriptional regulator [Alistipes sp.]|nr:GntR family transcriptional regulator [Candidatus Alistipes equi]
MKNEIIVDPESHVPTYKQLINYFEGAIIRGELHDGEIIPSMNELAFRLSISKETVKKSYGILREKGFIEPKQGKGFYVRERSSKRKLSVLILLDKLSSYKQMTINGVISELGDMADSHCCFFNQNIDLFEYYINENLGRHDYYIISPHFPLEEDIQRRAVKNLGRIPNHKLILVDRYIPELQGNYGAVYQDFANDAYTGLSQGLEKLRTIAKLNVIIFKASLYGHIIAQNVRSFCQDNSIEVEFMQTSPDIIEKGSVFLLLNSQLDFGLIDLIRKAAAQNLKAGHDFSIISYNETAIDEVVLDGLTTISTAFEEMGREAARMIIQKRMWKKHCPFKMTRRNTF